MMRMNHHVRHGLAALALIACAGLAAASADDDAKAKGDPYTLETCPVSGEKLGSMGDPVVRVYEGREVRFCCKGCIKGFEENQAKYWSQIDEQIIKRDLPHYPLTTCIVMDDEEIGSDPDEEPVNYVHHNRLVRFCCKGCVRKFKKSPEDYLKRLDAAVIAQQKEQYPLTTCLVSGEELGSMGDPVDMVVGNHLVRLCCNGCRKGIAKDPVGYLAKLNEAWKKQGHAHGKAPTTPAGG